VSNAIAPWVTLDDTELQKGCLHDIPGSQSGPVHPHETPIDPAQRKIYIEAHSAST
jgi:hypothetical protein